MNMMTLEASIAQHFLLSAAARTLSLKVIFFPLARRPPIAGSAGCAGQRQTARRSVRPADALMSMT